jgi:hypothetical protein
MNIPKEIIELAVKGGWSANAYAVAEDIPYEKWTTAEHCEIALDRTFWEALGRAKGWEQGEFELCFGCGRRITKDTPDRKTGKHFACKSDIMRYPSQANFQHKLFCERVCDGENLEDYWRGLLN